MREEMEEIRKPMELEEIEEFDDSKHPHYVKAIKMVEFLTSYNVLWSYAHENPKLKQQARHMFDPDQQCIGWCTAHYTYVHVRSIIQGN